MIDKCKKTLRYWIKLSNDKKKIFEFLSHESKNIFNHYLFCLKIYNKYKFHIYGELNNEDNEINDVFLEKMQNKFNLHSKYFELLVTNNSIIYNYIKSQHIDVFNYNFDMLCKKYTIECEKLVTIKDGQSELLFIDIISAILKKLYFCNFYKTKMEMTNKRQLTILDKKFIEHVKSKNCLFAEHSIKPKNLKSDQNLIRRFALMTYTKREIPCDVIINIMDKCYSTYLSQMKLKEKGYKTGDIKYLHKDGYFNVLYFNHSFKIIEDRIRLNVGSFIAENYNEILERKYGLLKQTKLYSVYKKRDKAIYGNYIFVNIPKYLKDKLQNINIKMIEICPQYEGSCFKLSIVYDEAKKIDKIEPNKIVDDMISIDLGMKNLMTIYDPSSIQHIVKGSNITSINHYFDMKIDYLKSKLTGTRKTSNKIRKLLIQRENKVNTVMDKITSSLFKIYGDKNTIVIGYNEGWKQEIKIGRKNNRHFCEIAFLKLINKIRCKFTKSIVETTGEAYTSKCDGLSLEKIGKHDEYKGNRVKRGLYASKTNKLINADLNGAINIMRLYCEKKEIPFVSVGGINLCNPVCIKINL